MIIAKMLPPESPSTPSEVQKLYFLLTGNAYFRIGFPQYLFFIEEMNFVNGPLFFRYSSEIT
jgi:hypothetical protein